MISSPLTSLVTGNAKDALIDNKQKAIPAMSSARQMYGRSYQYLKREGIILMGDPIKKEKRIVPITNTGATIKN